MQREIALRESKARKHMRGLKLKRQKEESKAQRKREEEDRMWRAARAAATAALHKRATRQQRHQRRTKARNAPRSTGGIMSAVAESDFERFCARVREQQNKK